MGDISTTIIERSIMRTTLDSTKLASPHPKRRDDASYKFILTGKGVTCTLAELVSWLEAGSPARLGVMAKTAKGKPETYVLLPTADGEWEESDNSFVGKTGTAHDVVPVFRHTGPPKHKTIIVEFKPTDAKWLRPFLNEDAVVFTSVDGVTVVAAI